MVYVTFLRSRIPLWLSWSSVMNLVVSEVRLFSARLSDDDEDREEAPPPPVIKEAVAVVLLPE